MRPVRRAPRWSAERRAGLRKARAASVDAATVGAPIGAPPPFFYGGGIREWLAVAKLGCGGIARTLLLILPRDSGAGWHRRPSAAVLYGKHADAKRRLWRSVVEGARAVREMRRCKGSLPMTFSLPCNDNEASSQSPLPPRCARSHLPAIAGRDELPFPDLAQDLFGVFAQTRRRAVGSRGRAVEHDR